jgi:LacI family repressor for deo operon, udp, cdd, tsx, nupC, and nupG
VTGIDDVARATGVSIATVSRALRGLSNVSEPTRERIQRSADELGYVASSSASGLASGRTRAMGVVVPSVSRWFYTTVLEGIDAELRAASYDLILFNLGGMNGDRERVFHRSILRKRTDALIALCLDFTADERKQLSLTGHPVIVVGGPVRGLRHIGIDERAVARKATEHLIALGHREILHLGGEDDDGLNRRVPIARRRGYEDAMIAAGIPTRSEWAIQGRFSLAHSREVVGGLLSSAVRRPTAIFADSDEMAIGAMLAIREHGLSVPDDISVIGIDGHDLASSFGLTTFAQDPFAQGSAATALLLDELGGRPARATSVRAPTRFILRASTAPPHS